MRNRTIRMLSLAGFAAAAIAATPALAHDHDDYYRHGRFAHEHYPPGHARHYVRETVVVERPVVIERAPVVVHEWPQVSYDSSPGPYLPGAASGDSGHSGWGTLGGAVAGAAIGSRIGQGNGRTAAIAIGTVMGAFVGDRLATEH